jgi:hypothetical protein
MRKEMIETFVTAERQCTNTFGSDGVRDWNSGGRVLISPLTKHLKTVRGFSIIIFVRSIFCCHPDHNFATIVRQPTASQAEPSHSQV